MQNGKRKLETVKEILKDFAILNLHFALCNAVQQLLFMAELLFPPHQERFKYLEEIHSNESSGPLQFPFLANGGHAIGMKGLKSV